MLLFARGKSVNEVATACGVGYQTAYGWQQQYKRGVKAGAVVPAAKAEHTAKVATASMPGVAVGPAAQGPKEYWCNDCKKYSPNKRQCGFCLLDR